MPVEEVARTVAGHLEAEPERLPTWEALTSLLGGVLRAWLYGLEPTDPTTLAACVALLAAVTVLASLAPARRAARTDPVVTLREE